MCVRQCSRVAGSKGKKKYETSAQLSSFLHASYNISTHCTSSQQQRIIRKVVTWAWVPSGRVMTGLLGSTWTMETVPSGLEMVCTTPEIYWPT